MPVIRRINGKDFSIPTADDGRVHTADLRRAANIPSNRQIVVKRPDGSNELLNSGQMTYINPQDHIDHLPNHKRGQE